MAGEVLRVDRLWPDPAPDLALDDAFADMELPAPPPGRAWLALNMVTSIDGRATRAGTAEGLAARADRRLMRLLRSGHDAVASGAGTLRRADFFSRLPRDLADRRVSAGRPAQPTALVLAGTGEVPVDRRFFAGDQPRIVVVGAGSPAAEDRALRDVSDVIVAPTQEPEPGWVLEQLPRRGIRSVLLEGGPTVNARFLGADLIDEVFWTIGARLIGNDGLPMIAPIPGGSPWDESPRMGRLVSCHRSGDDLFLRYRFRAVEQPATG